MLELPTEGLDVSISGVLVEKARGSLYWMAPETLWGDPYGRRSDIWALGCTLIEIATGKHAWYYDQVKDLEDLKTRLLKDQLPKLPSLNENALDFIR